MRGKKILIVDDQKFAVQMLRDALAPLGFVIEEASDGAAACRLTLEFQPDVILMDLVMPGMDGVETCRKIKQDDRTSATTVLVITANRDKENLVAAFEAGADDYLTKPVSDHELLARIKSNLMKRESLTLLEQKSRLFEALFQHASEGGMVLNARGELLNINKEALHILGCSREESLSLTIADLLAPESYEDAMGNHMNFFLGCDFRKKQELVFRTRSGEKRFVSVSVSEHRLKGEHAIVSFRDVTEEMMAMQQLKAANERLQGLAHLKSEYMDTATHELRIPVTVIHSYCSLIKEMGDDNLTDAQRTYLDAALEGSERLTELIDGMLDLSKLDAGKEEMTFEENNILEPIREVYTVLAPIASKNGLDVFIEPVQETVSACFDSAHIRCVLTNLIGNAIKFTPRGGKIGISVAREGNDVHVSVSDTGEGIPEKYVSRIFDEFCQVRPNSGSKKGSGLGLAICKRIVDAHNGKMWVQSTPRKGSRFTFSLPVSRD